MSNDNKPRFIRRGGRIIPIGGKRTKKQVNKTRNVTDKLDFATGAGISAVAALFSRRKKFHKGLQALSIFSGVATTQARFKNEKKGSDFVKQDLSGMGLKVLGAITGAVAGTAALIGAKKLNKLRKLKR